MITRKDLYVLVKTVNLIYDTNIEVRNEGAEVFLIEGDYLLNKGTKTNCYCYLKGFMKGYNVAYNTLGGVCTDDNLHS